MEDQDENPIEAAAKAAATVPITVLTTGQAMAPVANVAPESITLPLRPTLFAGPYRSTFALKVEETSPGELDCLQHVNCSYLSTKGLPPTLLQLKQHAQSLTVLIKLMTVSTQSSVVDNRNIPGEGISEFHPNESFDWLNDLTTPYENADRHHAMPLTSLLNSIDSTPWDNSQHMDMCPLHRADVRAPRNGISLPYATHQTLIQHANEVLELLDHEYSAKGGLLSILPPKDQKEDRELAETTLLGQLILYVSRLVQRVHDLERQYANALEVIKGEAAVPHQALSSLGPHGRQPRELVYPQDRFVLVNAGDDVWQYLNNEFQIKEAAEVEADIKAREQGIMGEALWKEGKGKAFAQGITALDITTRYYRLRSDSLDTIFIIPAYQEHPGTKVTREMETQPTVVSVVKPVWPERASMWEMRNRDNLEELKRLRNEHMLLQMEANNAKQVVKGVFMDQQLKSQELRELKATGNQDLQNAQAEIRRLNAVLQDPANESQLRVIETSNAALEAQNRALAAEREYKEKTEALEQERKKAEEVTRARGELKAKEEARLQRMEETIQARLNQRTKKLDERDVDIARAAAAINAKLWAIWEKQIVEQQIVIEFLKNKSAVLHSDLQPSEEDKTKGTAIAKKIIADMQPGSAQKSGASTTGRSNGANSGTGGGDRGNNGPEQAQGTTGHQGVGKDTSLGGYSVRGGGKVTESNSPGNSSVPPTGASGEVGMAQAGNKKHVKATPGKSYKNKNNLVTWTLEDMENVELVEDDEVADDEDEGDDNEEGKGKKQGQDVVMQ